MLELNQILRANEINFAILAGLPALMFLGLLGYSVRWSLSQVRCLLNTRENIVFVRFKLITVENECSSASTICCDVPLVLVFVLWLSGLISGVV